MSNGIGITSGVLNWQFQGNYVERAMDNSAYQAAHPDDTLVLAGPARFSSVNTGAAGTNTPSTLLAIGMLQAVSFSQSKPTQPMMAIGSGRSFFVSGKAQTQWTMARLFVNGRNMLRVLYHNAVSAGLDVENFDDKAAQSKNSNFFINLDSELYYVPFGLGAFFRNKLHDLVGSFYSELCMINSYNLAITAGQSTILENVSGLADRLYPMDLSTVAGAPVQGGVARSTVDTVLDFASPPDPTDNATTMDDNVGGIF